MEWRPIEEAPKDGLILVCGGQWSGEVSGETDDAGPWLVHADAAGTSFYVHGGDYYSTWVSAPTHFAELPEPPKVDG